MEPLLSFTSHIAGKNATVRVFPDHIEWDKKGWMSTGAKAATAAMTVGMSYLVTGVRGQRESESIPISAISHIGTKTSRFQDYVVITTSGGNVEMRVSKAEADALISLVHELMSGRHPSLQSNGPVPAILTQVESGPSLTQLAQWHSEGIISDEEFAAAKRKALGI